jgi:hypothetical protein
VSGVLPGARTSRVLPSALKKAVPVALKKALPAEHRKGNYRKTESNGIKD